MVCSSYHLQRTSKPPPASQFAPPSFDMIPLEPLCSLILSQGALHGPHEKETYLCGGDGRRHHGRGLPYLRVSTSMATKKLIGRKLARWVAWPKVKHIFFPSKSSFQGNKLKTAVGYNSGLPPCLFTGVPPLLIELAHVHSKKNVESTGPKKFRSRSSIWTLSVKRNDKKMLDDSKGVQEILLWLSGCTP